MSLYVSIPIASIDVTERFRILSRGHAEKLTVAFTDYGRTAPIIVRPQPSDPERFILVAGLHRIEGARAAGLSHIDAEVRELTADEARRVEIAENTFRFELTALDRMRSLAELARLWTAEHPKNPGGRHKKNRGQVGHSFEEDNVRELAEGFAERFSKEARQATGLAERSIRRDVATANALSPKVIALIAATPLADNAAQLKRLAAESPEDQLLIARSIASGETGSVKAARLHLGIAATIESDPEEKRFLAFVDIWQRAKPRTRRQILAHIERSKLRAE